MSTTGINHWTGYGIATPPGKRDFDRVDYPYEWWHAQLGDDCFCKQAPPPAQQSTRL
jgi:hypothetical protein